MLHWMANEREENGRRVIQPEYRQDVFDNEQKMGELVVALDDWSLANTARCYLLDLVNTLPKGMKIDPNVKTLKDIPTPERQRRAVLVTGYVMLQAAASGLWMIAHGYPEEAKGPARRMVEVRLHAQKILADHSGEYATRYLKGQAGGNIKQKAGGDGEIWEGFSAWAHGDPSSLRMDTSGPGGRLKTNDATGIGRPMIGVLPDLPAYERAAQWFAATMMLHADALAGAFEVDLDFTDKFNKRIIEIIEDQSVEDDGPPALD
jgi:hypothetical protein